MSQQYTTITKTIGDVVLTASKPGGPPSAADRLEAFLKWLSNALSKPDNTLPGAPGHPDNSLPGGGGQVDNSLPGGGNRPDNSLPGQGGRPDNTLPGGPSHKPVEPDEGHPDNSLPGSGGRPTHPIAGVIGENAKEIAKIILKNTACDPDKPQPK